VNTFEINGLVVGPNMWLDKVERLEAAEKEVEALTAERNELRVIRPGEIQALHKRYACKMAGKDRLISDLEAEVELFRGEVEKLLTKVAAVEKERDIYNLKINVGLVRDKDALSAELKEARGMVDLAWRDADAQCRQCGSQDGHLKGCRVGALLSKPHPSIEDCSAPSSQPKEEEDE